MRRDLKLLSGLLSLLICVTSYFIFALLDAEYYHLTKAYSELSAVGKANSIAFSILGFLLPGLLVAYFAYSLRRVFVMPKFPIIMIGISGLLIAISAAPMNYENWSAPTSMLHIIGSMASGFFFVIGAISLHRFLRNDPKWRPISILLLALLIVMIASAFFRNSNVPGLAQKIGILIYYLYIAVLSLHSYRLSGQQIA